MARRTKRRSGKQHPLLAETANMETIGDWLRFAVTCFNTAPLSFTQGLHNPQEEAMFLVSSFLGLEQDDLLHFLNARLTQREIETLQGLLIRRIDEHVPTAYLVNEASLGGFQFYVDERVLIPRSYIVELIPGTLHKFAGKTWRPKCILDIGTGSGCLAILAAHAFPEALVDAVDISTAALEVASVNVAAHGLGDRVHLIRSDLFSGLPEEHYDLIIANPPYEPTDVVAEQPPEFGHEPASALDGGEDGMDCVRRIVAEAGKHLNSGGILILEFGELRPLFVREYPKLRHTVLPLADGSDAVVGIKAADFSTKPRSRKKSRR